MQETPMTADAYILPFDQLRMQDVGEVGGKNASLGEMITQLDHLGVRVPRGFATTASAYRDFLAKGGLTRRIEERLKVLDVADVKALAATGAEIREWIVNPKAMVEKTKATRKPDMPAYPKLAKDDVDALVAYMVSLKKK